MTARPPLPPAFIVDLPGRGEICFRHHRHPDPTRPTLLLLHGWTASADVQWVAMYERLGRDYSFVAVDHRGHGRGMRTVEPFDLTEVADDAAALVRHLGLGPVAAVGYSMGGPISMLLTRRHQDLVSELVVMATALEWCSTRRDRWSWKLLWLLERTLRSGRMEGGVRRFMQRCARRNSELAPWVDHLRAELRRGDVRAIRQAGDALARHDARPWAGELGVPAAMVVTTKDRLVLPAKQRELARALRAQTFEVKADHDATWSASVETSDALLAALDSLRVRQARSSA